VARLTAAALETLGIVAYKQPIIKADMESIRGVNVDGVIATLLERNLITAVGRDNRPGRPVLYGTTPEFLRYFGLTSLSELPKIEELEEYLKARQAEREKMDAEIDAELGLQRLSGYGTQEEVPFEGHDAGAGLPASPGKEETTSELPDGSPESEEG
jgi:segregation and condensation protein B